MKITRLRPRTSVQGQLAHEVKAGLAADSKSLPTRFLYDGRGSELFEEITRLPEYYPTRMELSLLEARATEMMATARPEELVELGSGSSRKTCLLLEAMHAVGSGDLYAPLDVSEDALLEAESHLKKLYPWLRVLGAVGDFEEDIPLLPRHGRRLIVFLGSTLGNLSPSAGSRLFAGVHESMEAGDRFLLGLDTTSDRELLEAAYNDSQGVTAAFSLNLLTVLNRELGANFELQDFEHVARWVPERSSIETFLRARHAVVVSLPALEQEVSFAAGEETFIERSRKFTRDSLGATAQEAGLSIERWDTDPGERHALALLVSA